MVEQGVVKAVHGYITTGDMAKDSSITGAWVGGLFGIIVGAAFFWLPGFGPLSVAGPLAAALLGGLKERRRALPEAVC